MTQTCTTCFDDTCTHMGHDERACDHYVRLSDLDPQPVVDTPSSSSQGLLTLFPAALLDEFDTRLRNLERMVCDIGRAVRGELP